MFTAYLNIAEMYPNTKTTYILGKFVRNNTNSVIWGNNNYTETAIWEGLDKFQFPSHESVI